MKPLFCKPGSNTNEILFAKFCPEINATISFRSLDVKKDLPVIHEWVNLPYSETYWQMNGHFSQLAAIYQCMEFNPYAHSFVGLLDGKMICQYDVYSVLADELREHIDATEDDCGFHLLMAPKEVPLKGLTKNIVSTFLEFYFSFPQAKKMYAEPDIENSRSILLLEKCGFKNSGIIKMSYKIAVVYCLKKPL